MPGFTHLHCHSEYSLLDGLARVPDLVTQAKERGFDALALTDHGVMFGAVQFYQKARKAGIKPILGCELYVARRGRGDRDAKLDRKPYHLTVLAESDQGYRNLLALVSRAQLEGFYYRPRVDRELLEQYAEGLVVFSGCPGSEVASAIIDGRMDDAREAIGWYKTVFAGRYYIELMVHDIEFIPRLNRGLLELAREFDLPTVATNDVHYCREVDVNAHEVLLCVQTNTTMNDPKRMRIGDSFYLRTEEEMRRLFAEMEAAVDRTAEVAERCNVELEFGAYKLPRFEVPEGQTAAGYLAALCEKGLRERYETITETARARLSYELSIIGQMGFDDYFLIVWDLCRYAAELGIWWNVRGSGAGSIVAYCLRITNIDPLRHGLIFERFLNPSRVSMPDIDLDFPDDQRDLLIQYTFDRYGHDKVAQIITFGTMGARAAIRDAGRALEIELGQVDRLARLVPAVPGKACSIADTMRPGTDEEPNEFYVPEIVQLQRDDEVARELLKTAQSLEGVTRHASTHAAGVVITDRPLVDYVPLHRPTRGGADTDDPSTVLAVTQYNMKDVDALGLLKVDFLGLSTLTVLRRAAELVERYHGTRYTLDSIPLDDPKIYELLSSGDVTGVFQVEGAGMRKMLREMRPKQFENVVAAIALYRPGPMQYIPTYIARLHGRERVAYRHPALEPILEETYGIIVYQEQIIQIARDLAGYDAGEADMIRKAVAKKIKEKLLEHRRKFCEGAEAKGIPRPVAEGIFDDIETFARYGFNKAHAADYAVIVCQTAYLKAHYPVEYAAALLSVDRDDTDKIALVAADCHRQGIALLAPDVSRSGLDFLVEHLDPAEAEAEGLRARGIRFGLGAVKNVGQGAVEAIVTAREEGGPFLDLDALATRVDMRQVGKRALESLVKAGALDAYGPRRGLLSVVDRMVARSSAHHQAAEIGQMSLFGDATDAAEVPLLESLPEVEGDHREELLWEKELIGLYLSEHPLHRVTERLAETVTAMTGDVTADMAGQPVTLAGLVTSVRTITTKKGDPMAFVRLEDLQGDIELIVFPRTYEETRALWKSDEILMVQGKVEQRDERTQLIVDVAERYDPDAASPDAETEAAPPPYETYRQREERRPDPPAHWAKADANGAAVATSGAANGTTSPKAAGGPAKDAPTDATRPGRLERDADAVPRETAPAAERQTADEARSSAAPRPAEDALDTADAAVVVAPEQGPCSDPVPVAVPDPDPSPASTPPSGLAAEPAPTPVPASRIEAARAAAIEDPELARYRLELTLPRREDQDEAVRLLGQVFQTLTAYEGADRFTLLVPNGPELVQLDFPNHHTRYCVDLLDKLTTLVGDARIRVRGS